MMAFDDVSCSGDNLDSVAWVDIARVQVIDLALQRFKTVGRVRRLIGCIVSTCVCTSAIFALPRAESSLNLGT